MKKVITLTLFLCFIFLGLMLNKNNYSKNNIEFGKHILETEKIMDVPHIPNDETMQIHKEVLKEKVNIVNQVKSFFLEKDLDEVLLSVNALESIAPIAAISMKRNNIRNLKVGDTFVLPSIDGIEYILKVTSKDKTYSGDISISGSFYEDGIKYSSILTEGNESSFISMMIPEGNFEIEMFDGLGLVYSVSDIENARIDYSKEDTI